MNLQFLPLNQLADQSITAVGARSRILAAAIALAASNAAALPSSPVDGAMNYFTMQVKPQANIALAQFNENMVFDLRAACDFLRVFWMIRYTAAHPAKRPVYSDACGFFDAINGVNLQVSDEDCKFFDEHKRAILLLSVAAGEVIEKLCQSEADCARG